MTLFEQLRASPTGRPALFRVMRDAALELGDAAAEEETYRSAELWHRTPEEWELGRVLIRGALQRRREAIDFMTLSRSPLGRLEQVRELLDAGLITPAQARRALDVRAEPVSA